MSTSRGTTHWDKSDADTQDITVTDDLYPHLKATFYFISSELAAKGKRHVVEVNGNRCGISHKDLGDVLELLKAVYES